MFFDEDLSMEQRDMIERINSEFDYVIGEEFEEEQRRCKFEIHNI